MDDNKKEPKIDAKNLKKPHYYGVRDGIHIFHGTDESHKTHVGKHLENPSDEDLKSGLDEAKSKKLNALYVHGVPPKSFRSEIHPQIGVHVPGEMKKSESDPKPQEQYWFQLKHPHTTSNSNYVKYEMHRSDVLNTAKNYDSEASHVLSHTVKPKNESKTGLHATAIQREKSGTFVPSKPTSDHVGKNGSGEGKKILYHGCGRDFGGALALAGEGARLERDPMLDDKGNQLTNDGIPLYQNHRIVGGKNQVDLYDPYHYDPSIKNLPTDKYDEVHSHYTFNVINHDEGKKVMGEIGGLLKPEGKAVISARRDSGMKTNDHWENLKQQARSSNQKKATPKAGDKPALSKADAPSTKMSLLESLHNEVKDHAKKSGITLPDHIFKIKPKKSPVPDLSTKEKALKPIKKIEELKLKAKDLIKQVLQDEISLTTKDLAKGLISPEIKCDDCGCDVEGCMCFTGLPEPKFTFDGKKLTILFKAEWDEASKEAYLDDFKKRAGRLLKKQS